MSEYPAIIELSDLDGSKGFKIAGAQANAQFGISVAAAGDVNGDGIDDFVVGAQSQDVGSGASYVVFGHAGAFGATFDLSTLDGSNGFRIAGEHSQDFSGRCVSSAGDVNGDGFGDLIVGAPSADPHGDSSGASYVVFGKASGFDATLPLSSLDGSNGFKINGEASFDVSGFAVSGGGDINGDGLADIIVSSFRASPNGNASGAAYVVFGKAGGFSSPVELSDLDGSDGFKLEGEAAGDRAGRSVSNAGDLNGDGYDDLIVGAYSAHGGANYSGVSYVVFGGPEFDASVQLADLDGNNGFRIDGLGGADYSGRSVSAAGDVNADGIADFVIGAPGHNSHGFRSGAAYVVFGTTGGFPASFDLSDLDGTNGFQIRGNTAGDQAGTQVSGAGDVNGDGFADLIVGAQYADPNGNYSGASYVVFGNASGFAGTVDVSDLDGDNGFKLNGAAAEDRSGFWVSGAGDVNHDGFDDVTVGAFLANANGTDSGAAYIVFGGKPDEAVTRNGTATANAIHGGDFGDTVSGLAGDDTLIGHDGNDSLYGGNDNDTLDGGEGDDLIDGGDGADTASYADAASAVTVDLTIDAAQDTGGAGFDTLAAIENLVGTAFGDTLNGDGVNNTIDGGDGKDTLNGGGGDDITQGGAAADDLDLSDGGNDFAYGGLGSDKFFVGTSLTAEDLVDGGGGADTLFLAGDYMTGVIFAASTMTGIETISLASGFSYGLVLADANVDHDLAVDASALNTADTLHWDSTDESAAVMTIAGGKGADVVLGGDGKNTFAGGAGDDTLSGGSAGDNLQGGSGGDVLSGNGGKDTITGGANDDAINGGLGADRLSGGQGLDTFAYASSVESTQSGYDRITDVDFAADRFDIWFTVTGIDVETSVAKVGKLDSQLDGSELGANHAVIVNIGAHKYLAVDANGVAGWQDGADLLVRIDHASNTASLDTGDFI